MKKLIQLISASLLAIVLPQNLLAQSGPARLADQVFVDSFGTFQGGFGFNTAMDGEWLAVAYRFDDSRNIGEGSIYMYRRRSTGYTLFQILRADSIQSLGLGTADLSIKGNLCIVSAVSYANPNQSQTGAAYLFEFDGNQWNLDQRLEPSDSALALNNAFGLSLAIADPLTVLVGAFNDPLPSSTVGSPPMSTRFRQKGAIYVFSKTSTGWIETQKIKTHHPMASEGFSAEGTRAGLEIAVHGDTAIIGTRQHFIRLMAIGGLFHANTLHRDAQGIWHESGQIIHLGGHYQEEYGFTVDIEGDLMAIGAPVEAEFPGILRPGSVYVYRRTAGQWSLETNLTASDASVTFGTGGVTSDRFGSAVSIDQGRILIGASSARPDDGEYVLGAAYLFEHINGAWLETRRFWTADNREDHFYPQRLGKDVSLQGDTVVVSDELGISNNRFGAGSVHVYYIPFGDETCTGVSNSTGQPAWIEATGSREVGYGHLQLRVGSLPQGFIGYLLAATQTGSISNIPGAMGTLCLGGNLARFKNQAALTAASGQVEIPINMSSVPTNPNAAIQSGQTWHFQYWYRDLVGGPTSNFSSAVGVTFR